MSGNDLRGWIRAAQDDFNATQFLLDEDPLRPEVVCFHAEQAAEKMLKAYLLKNGQSVPAVQDCGRLVDLCARFDGEIRKLGDDAAKLAGYQEFDQGWGALEISEEEMQEVLNASERILDYLEAKLQAR